jgi:hypothetical protein
VPIRRYIPQGVEFDPQAIDAMDEAFESAWRIIETARLTATKDVLAEKIISAAGRGVLDPESLRDAALSSLGLHR